MKIFLSHFKTINTRWMLGVGDLSRSATSRRGENLRRPGKALMKICKLAGIRRATYDFLKRDF